MQKKSDLYSTVINGKNPAPVKRTARYSTLSQTAHQLRRPEGQPDFQTFDQVWWQKHANWDQLTITPVPKAPIG